jgi:hypothetical protein
MCSYGLTLEDLHGGILLFRSTNLRETVSSMEAVACARGRSSGLTGLSRSRTPHVCARRDLCTCINLTWRLRSPEHDGSANNIRST